VKLLPRLRWSKLRLLLRVFLHFDLVALIRELVVNFTKLCGHLDKSGLGLARLHLVEVGLFCLLLHSPVRDCTI